MPVLHCYVDERTLDLLRAYARETGRSVEELAEAAISDAAVASQRQISTQTLDEMWGD